MLRTIKRKFIGDKAFYKTVLALVIPLIIQQGITSFVSLLDNIMVGALGTASISAVAIVNQLMMVFNLTIFGAISGVALGALGSWLSAFIRHKFRGDGISAEELSSPQKETSGREILRRIIKIAIPIALGSCVGQVTGVIDLFSVYDRLHHAVDTGYATLMNIYDGAIPVDKALEDIPNYLNGCYKGMVVTLYNLIPTFTVAFGVSALPAITSAWTEKNTVSLKENVEAVLRMTMLLVLPAGIGMSAMSHGVLTLLYGSKPAEVEIAVPLLAVLGIAVIFSSACSPINSMLQAVGRADLPVKIMVGCAAFKLIFNYITVGIPEINILGAAIGTLICYIMIMFISLFFLFRITELRINYMTVFIKPLLSAVLCAGTAKLISWLIMPIASENIATILGIVCGGVVYVASLILFGAITEEDIRRLPKGEKLVVLYNKLPGKKK